MTQHDPNIFTPTKKHAGWVGDVSFSYSRGYDQFWVERGHYTSYSGEVDFHGKRVIPSGKDTLSSLRQAVARGDRGYDFGDGIRISENSMQSLLTWLEKQMEPYPAVEAKDVNTEMLNALESGVTDYATLSDLLGIGDQTARSEMQKLEKIGLAKDDSPGCAWPLKITTRGAFLLRAGAVKAQESDAAPQGSGPPATVETEDLNVVQF